MLPAMSLPTCLIVVDVQSGFICSVTAPIPAAVSAFCKENSFEHRIFTRFINPGNGGPFVKILGWSHLQNEEEIALAPEVADLPTVIVDKHTYSPFVDTKLEDRLRNLGVHDVLVCGIDTDICVLTTAVDLFDRGFRPFVIKDLSMSHAGPEFHEAAIKILPRYIGANSVVTIADIPKL